MAEDVVEHSIAVPRAEPDSLVEPLRPREHPRVYRWRFGLAYLVLAVLGGAGVGLAVMLLDRPEDAREVAWSDWKPVGRETSYARQIAEFISPRYRGTDGNQLVPVVGAGPPTVAGLPVEAIVIRHEPPVARGRSEFEVHGAGNTVAYTLCGSGVLCSSETQTSPEELLLLRRQGLELALYTLKYVEEAEAVVVLLPTDIAGTPDDRSDDRRPALYFRKSQFGRELDRPLRATLPAAASDSDQAQAADAVAVGRLTNANFFDARPDRLQNDAAYLDLTPTNARP